MDASEELSLRRRHATETHAPYTARCQMVEPVGMNVE